MRENAGTPLMTPPGSWAVLGAIFALLLGLGLLLTSDRTPESRSTDSSLPATQISEDHLDDGPGGAIYRVLKLKQRFTIDERLAVFLWNADEKLVWQNGEYYLIDLSSDAAEQSPQPLGHHPLRPELEAIVAKMQETGSRSEESVDEALVERLKALGYLQ